MLAIIKVISLILIRYHKSYLKEFIKPHTYIFDIYIKSIYVRTSFKN